MVHEFGRIVVDEHKVLTAAFPRQVLGLRGRCLVLRSIVCKLCGSSFEYGRKPGAPRQYCYACEPRGYALVKVRGRLKLRRRPAAFSLAELRAGDPEILAHVSHLPQFRPSGRGGEAA